MRKMCGVLSLLILGAMVFCIFYGAPSAIYTIERDTKAYLNEQGYTAETIKSVKGHYDRKGEKGKKYYAEVVLANEKEVQQVLVFQYDQAGNIEQSQQK